MRSSLFYLVKALGDLYLLAFLLRFLLQWVRADFYNPLTQAIVQITNPLVRPARRFIPTSRSVDMPTLAVLVVLEGLLTWLLLNIGGIPSGSVAPASSVDHFSPHQPFVVVLLGQYPHLRHSELGRPRRASSHCGRAGRPQRTDPPPGPANSAHHCRSRPVSPAGTDHRSGCVQAAAPTRLPGLKHDPSPVRLCISLCGAGGQHVRASWGDERAMDGH